jgi:predicted  nucleic acid-binding Zn-ribbon protein
MSESTLTILQKIRSFRRKYYLNLAIRGVILFLAALLGYYLLANFLEFSLRLPSIARGILLLLFLGLTGFCFHRWVLFPIWYLMDQKKGLPEEEVARRIGENFPEVKDKLLNILQLYKYMEGGNPLAAAGIHHKSNTVSVYDFESAIDLRENWRFLRFLAIPLLLIVLVFTWNPAVFRDGTQRIVRFDKEFVPEAPFQFIIDPSSLTAFKNEDFLIELTLEGEAIPGTVFLGYGGRSIKMTHIGGGQFTYTIPKIQSSRKIYFEAAGFTSPTYVLEVVNRPNLQKFDIELTFPAYLKRKPERQSNTGNLEVPEGTDVTWLFQPLDAQSMFIVFEDEAEEQKLQSTANQLFEYKKQIRKSGTYEVKLRNSYSHNKEKIQYGITAIADQYPSLAVQVFQDTTLYQFISLGGNIADDYGLSRLSLYYQVKGSEEAQKPFERIDIPINPSQNSQGFYYQWGLEGLRLQEGASLEYYVQVWDNDGINGPKSSKTGMYSLRIPSRKEIKESMSQTSLQVSEKMDKTLQQAKDLQVKIDKENRRLKGKKDLNWEDENKLRDIIKQREQVNKAIQELQEQAEENKNMREQFSSPDDKLKEKMDQLQELIDQLQDEETERLYEELQKMLDKQKDMNSLRQTMERLNRKERNLEKELERAMELFKRMQFDFKLDDAIKDLENQVEDLNKMAEESKSQNTDNQELKEKNESLKEGFEQLEEQLDELRNMNQELKNPTAFPETSEEEKAIKDNLQKSKEQLENNKPKDAAKSQENAAGKTKEIKDKLSQMQSSMEMQMMQENLDHLRKIMHNLVRLSFNQEALMKEFRTINQSNPQFVELSQTQLKLKDDAKILEDSLIALSKRVMQIESFVTREVGEMNQQMENSLEALRERKNDVIRKTTTSQQLAMTSMNNLALMLDNTMDQMMEAMQASMGMGKSEKNMPSPSELQMQLNQQMNDVKQSEKSGRELSEEMARMAAEQARIRKMMEEMKEKLDRGGGETPADGLSEKMEQTEWDLVNKRITEQTIRRQKEILTRMLEAENALREREQDEQRKGETANPYEKRIPKAFEEYLKLKEKEVELLKTIPARLQPYYRKEINEYFQRIGNNQD